MALATPEPLPDTTLLGTSAEGREILAVQVGSGHPETLILAGVHGDEPKSVYVARRFVEYVTSDPIPRSVVIVPVVNPDGYAIRRRRNAAGVDLNRNFPAANWIPGNKRSRFYAGPSPASEPETRAVITLVETLTPKRIISIHSIDKRRFCNNYDGPAIALARKMAEHNKYPVTGSIGYATPGSFGTWAGVERKIPVVTLELPSHRSPKQCWLDNRDALLAGCR